MGIHGLAQATGWPHNVALFANWTHRSERGTLFGIWGTCYQLGAVAGKGLAGFLLGWLGLAWSFYGSSIVFFAITVAFIAAGAGTAAIRRPDACRLRRARPPAGRSDARDRGAARGTAAAGFRQCDRRDGPDLFRLQVPALRARQLVGAHPRRAFRAFVFSGRLLVDRLRLDRPAGRDRWPAGGRIASRARAARRSSST